MDPTRPVPVPSPLTAPYWEACRRGELVVQHCTDCGRFIHFPEASCPFCGSGNLPWEAVSGLGRVHTFSTVHRSFLPGFTPPFTVAWIDLDEDVRVFGGLLADEPRIGARVQVCFDELPGFGPVPQWRAV
ncbi:OB-fold domain-containing protein [Actinocorallia lasiicapitis]